MMTVAIDTRRSVYVEEGIRLYITENGEVSVEMDEGMPELTSEELMAKMVNRVWKMEQRISLAVNTLHEI